MTYLQNEGEELEVGDLVEVPLGRRKSEGVILDHSLKEVHVKSEIEGYKVKEIGEKQDDIFSLTSKELELYKWMAKYYHYSLGQLVFDCLPKILKRPRNVDFPKGLGEPFEFELNEIQRPIFDTINTKLDLGFDRFYVHGVTGSGKTLIYLNLIKEVMSKGKSALFLLPEINLTPQFVETFSKHLDCEILSYHSGVNNSEKNQIWRHLKESKKPVLVMGVRSSVFLPIENLGIVVVDEEHDQSFKQSDRCPYNGRDVAIKKAQISNCPIVLGSATPSMENYYTFAHNVNANYFKLEKRASGGFPDVEIIDARVESQSTVSDEHWPLEQVSIDSVREAFEKDEQVLVFVNRLGFANYIQCRCCGHRFIDPNTETNLRYFKSKNKLVSAHSDFEIQMPEVCPTCGNMNLLQKGFGTEKIAEVLSKIFPEKRVERFDRDEIKNLSQLEDKLNRFHRGEIDLFVGTQMLSKGHNFKRVNTVLILGVDSMLNFPDFRAFERTFQTITQITGRSGRYGKDSKVLIQSLCPESNIFDFVKGHSFDGFYKNEINIRSFSEFSPFSKLVTIHFSSRFKDRVMSEISLVAKNLRSLIDNNNLDCEVLGPAPAAVERKASQYSWYILLKGKDINALHNVLNTFEGNYKVPSSVSYKIDVDPYFIS